MDVVVDEHHIDSDSELSKALQEVTIGALVYNTQAVATMIDDAGGHSRVHELNKLHERITKDTFNAICATAQNGIEHFMLLGAVATSISMTFANEVDHIAFMADLEEID